MKARITSLDRPKIDPEYLLGVSRNASGFMPEKRVNPDTGALEEKRWHGWTPSKNAEGLQQRVNPDTGAQEEKRWHGWTPSKNAEGLQQRVNPDTGAQEEKRSHGWTPSKNAESLQERVNPDTGALEEKRWHGWTPSKNAEGLQQRVNPDTGVQEEKRWHGWTPHESPGNRPGRPPMGFVRSRQTSDSSASSGASHAGSATRSTSRPTSDSSASSGSAGTGVSGGAIFVLFILGVIVLSALYATVTSNVAPVVEPPSSGNGGELHRRIPVVNSSIESSPTENSPRIHNSPSGGNSDVKSFSSEESHKKQGPVYAESIDDGRPAWAPRVPNVLPGLPMLGLIDGHCPKCQRMLRVRKEYWESLLKCPHCQEEFKIVKPPE
jgi:hypothetical protein